MQGFAGCQRQRRLRSASRAATPPAAAPISPASRPRGRASPVCGIAAGAAVGAAVAAGAALPDAWLPVLLLLPVLPALSPLPEPSELLMLGDSLTSDIAGAEAAGVDSCWFNPSGAKNESVHRPTYELRRYEQLDAPLD